MIRKLSRPEPQPPWSFPGAIAAIIAMFAALVIGTTLAQTVLDDSPAALLTGWSVGMILTVAFVLITRRRTPEDERALAIGPTRSRLPIVLLFGLGAGIALDLVSQAVTGEFNLASSELLTLSAEGATIAGWVIAFLFMGLLQPVGEELVFRGMLYPAVRHVLGTWSTLLMVAGFHAAFHFAAYTPVADDRTIFVWYGFVLPLLDALVITGVRAYTGSTRSAIMAHAGIGLFMVLKVLVVAG